MLTADQIRADVQSLCNRFERWRDDVRAEQPPSWVQQLPASNWRLVPASLTDAVRALEQRCDTVEAERDAKPLVLAFDQFMVVFRKCFEQSALAIVSADVVRQLSKDDLAKLLSSAGALTDLRIDVEASPLWPALERLREALTPRQFKQIESPQQLVRDGVRKSQVAKMHGWYGPDGQPDIQRVNEELANPGTHFESWSPQERRYWQQVATAWAQRCEQRGTAQAPAPIGPAVAPKRARRPCRESLDQLLEDGVNVVQISKMRCCSLDEVLARQVELGLDREGPRGPAPTYFIAQQRRMKAEDDALTRKMVLSKIDPHTELGDDRDARIAAMLKDGVALLDVRDRLRSAGFPSMHYADVEAVAESQAAAANVEADPEPEVVTTRTKRSKATA